MTKPIPPSQLIKETKQRLQEIQDKVTAAAEQVGYAFEVVSGGVRLHTIALTQRVVSFMGADHGQFDITNLLTCTLAGDRLPNRCVIIYPNS